MFALGINTNDYWRWSLSGISSLIIYIYIYISLSLSLLSLVQELLFPLMQIGELMLSLVEWEDPFKSHVFLFLFLFLINR